MLTWTPLALADREILLADGAQGSVPAAERDAHIEACAEQLIRQAWPGHPGRVAGTRELLSEPCLLVYQLGADENVTVLRVLLTEPVWSEGERNNV